ncbi:MAG: sensor histidine kinase, partial [Clostridium sp.]|nr:sensor histidine kinase [Clostridium sp.]
MNVWEYIKDKILTVILHFFCMILLSAFLFITGNTMTTVILILAAWIFILLAVLGLDGYRTIRYFNHMFAVLKELKDPYLVAEVLPLSDREQDRVYREVLRRCMKSVIEKIALIEGERKDYQEFIETWVHEVKAPMSVIRLILANEVCFDNFSNQILSRLSMIDNAIDIALYYARSDEVYRDYIIAPVILEEVIAHTLHQH